MKVTMLRAHVEDMLKMGGTPATILRFEASLDGRVTAASAAHLSDRVQRTIGETVNGRSADESDYELLRDAVITCFNPPDDDAAEPDIMVRAIDAARDWITGQPCACTPPMIEDLEPCGRCLALGQRGAKPVSR